MNYTNNQHNQQIPQRDFEKCKNNAHTFIKINVTLHMIQTRPNKGRRYFCRNNTQMAKTEICNN